MAKFVIHAGDFVEGNGLARLVAKDPSFFGKLKGQFTWEIFLPKGNGKAPPLAFGFGERLDISEFVKVEVADKESIGRFAAGVGWGMAGSVLLGPLGLVAGALLGGKKNEITFIGQLKNGKRMIATTDSNIFTLIKNAVFKNEGSEVAFSEEKQVKGDKYAELAQLKGLLDSGVLTQDEFDSQKAKILSGV